MTIESIVKSTMAKEIEEKMNQLDLKEIADKKIERYVKNLVAKEMTDAIRNEVRFAVKEYLETWKGKNDVKDIISSIIKVSIKDN